MDKQVLQGNEVTRQPCFFVSWSIPPDFRHFYLGQDAARQIIKTLFFACLCSHFSLSLIQNIIN